jgi:hypothetical protein
MEVGWHRNSTCHSATGTNTMTTTGFQKWGNVAWRLGLRAALQQARQRLGKAATDEERQQAQAELEALKNQQADAKLNGHRRLY